MDLVASDIDEFRRLQDALQNASDGMKNAQGRCDELADQIRKIEDQIIEHRQPAEDLNNDLRQYLGHGELQLAVKDTGYTITRNGEPAQMLSEGEMTAIALLYFLKSLEGRDFDLTNGVVVLDDPVSSLDANAMYLAFSLIRERTLNSGQLFVLTHNFAFFREMRNWLQRLRRYEPRARETVQFYMLECVEMGGYRASLLRPLDPLLRDYQSEYHYLFACVYRFVNESSPDGLAACYGMPNIARRLLEGFLAFRSPASHDLWRALREVAPTDELRRSRIYSFVQTHSHYRVVGQPEHDPSVLRESKAALRNVLEVIQSADPDHYAAMAELISSKGSEGGSS